MARRYYSSTAARTTLASGVNDSTTTFTVAAVSGWPSSFPYTLIIDQDTINEEIVEVTARSGTTLTVTRGVDGTTGVAHDAGAAVNHGVSARDFDEPNAFINGTDFVSTDGGSTVTASGAAVTPLVLKGASGQTADLLAVEDSAGTDLVVVDESGNVGIGTSSPDVELDVRRNDTGRAWSVDSRTVALFERDDNAGISIIANPSNESTVFFGDTDAENVARVSYAHSSDAMRFFTNGVTERMRINNAGAVLIGTTTPGSASTGDLVVNGGVFLGGNAAANELDDYEEGTWTPTYEPETGSFGSITYDANTAGAYTRIGNQVFIQFWIRTDAFSAGTASNRVRITGLPFAQGSLPGSSELSSINIGFARDWNTANPTAGFFSGNKIELTYSRDTDNYFLYIDVANMNTGADDNYIAGSAHYTAS